MRSGILTRISSSITLIFLKNYRRLGSLGGITNLPSICGCLVKQVYEEVNRKCRPRNTTVQLSTPYTDPYHNARHHRRTDRQTDRQQY